MIVNLLIIFETVVGASVGRVVLDALNEVVRLLLPLTNTVHHGEDGKFGLQTTIVQHFKDVRGS